MSLDGQRIGNHEGLAKITYDRLNVHLTIWMELESRVKRDIAPTVTIT